jgi:hypothetical protein
MSSLAVLALMASSVMGQAEETVTVPDKAVAELDYLKGSWKVEGRVGDSRYAGKQMVRWAPGKHCLIANWTGSLGDKQVNGTAILGWDACEEQIVDAGFIDTVGHRITRWTVETEKVWEGVMRGFVLGGEVEAAVRLEKKSLDEFVVVINAAGDMPENEYLFTKVDKAGKKKAEKSQP